MSESMFKVLILLGHVSAPYVLAIISHRNWVEDHCLPLSALDPEWEACLCVLKVQLIYCLSERMDTLQCPQLVSMVASGCKMQLHLCRNLVPPVISASLARGGDTKEGIGASTLLYPHWA